MKTKMIFIAVITILTVTSSFAQTKTTFGIRGGINFYNINGKDASGDKLENKIKTGFNAGVNAEIPVGIDFYLQPGVLFTTKGASDISGNDDKITLSYIEIPVNFIYKPGLGKGRLLLGFGPYAAFGVTGVYKASNGNESDVKFKNTITAADLLTGNTYFKGFDAGANLLFGYECASNLSFQLNAGLGLVNIKPDFEGAPSDDSSLKNTGFGVSVGYRF
jgi:Outer membrane protein beta-barrel domain